MPIINKSSYRPSLLYSNKHLNTIIPSLFRKIQVSYTRERIKTKDNDFIDIDFSSKQSESAVIILHGLEGSSDSSNVKGIVKAINSINLDAVVLNFRGCSGEINNLLSAYHSGKTDDINLVVDYISKRYKTLYMVGFSLGGNAMLKYLGENHSTHKYISKAVAISVPIDLRSSAIEMAKASNKIYMSKFLKTLKSKVFQKCKRHSNHSIDLKKIKKAHTFFEFDNEYTAPVHGFTDAEKYYKKNSSKFFLENIKTPTLLINAVDDPFLTQSCFPFSEAKQNQHLFLETPSKGGHLGFLSKTGINGIYWHEQRIMQFLQSKETPLP